jgi:Protein of unknown function (DUF3592)
MESILIIAIGIALLYVAFKFRVSTQKIAEKGIETEGVIFDVVPSKNPDSRANYPLIRFVTTEKEWITEEYSVSTIPGLFKKGQKVTVVYNSDNPKEFFVKSPITSLVPILLTILAVIILATGICKLLHVQL